MYSWLGEYWKEALAYIVILAYFLLKAALALATEVTEDYFSFSFWSLCKRHIIFWRFLDHIAFNVTLSKVNTGLVKSGDEFNYFVRGPEIPCNGFQFWRLLNNMAFNVICSKDSPNLRMSTAISHKSLHIHIWFASLLSIVYVYLLSPIFTPLLERRKCWGKTILPRAGYRLGTYRILLTSITSITF